MTSRSFSAISLSLLALAAALFAPAGAQIATVGRPTPLAATAPTAVPTLINYGGVAQGREGKPLSGDASATFLIFRDERGGEPLWMETQTVTMDASGHFQVQLGASSEAGVPAAAFATGEARWLEVQIPGQQPQPRLLLTSVPYAMKAAEAETLGGFPAAEFVTQAQLASAAKDLAGKASPLITPFVSPSGSGTTNVLPIWTNSSTLGNSFLSQSGAGVVVGTSTTPAPMSVYGNISNSASGTYASITSSSYNNTNFAGSEIALNRYEGTAAAPIAVQLNDSLGWFQFFGYDGSALQRSGELAVYADATPTAGVVPGRFQINTANSAGVNTGRLIAYSNDNVVMSQHGGKVGIGTSSQPAATLEVNGTAKFDGNITFASTQTFPITGTGGGTITGITTSSPLTGSGTSGSVALGLNTTTLETTLNGVYPQLNATTNAFKGGASFAGPVTAAGTSGAAMTGTGSSTAIGVKGVSASTQGVYGQVMDPGPGSSGTLGSTGTTLSAVYGTEAGVASAGAWGDSSSTASGISLGVFGTSDSGYGGAFVNNSSSFPAVFAFNSGPGGGAAFEAGATGNGVTATASAGDAVSGTTNNPGALNAGVLGRDAGSSATGEGFSIASGVWGDTSIASSPVFWNAGVLGTADDGQAGVFLNNSTDFTTLFAINYATTGSTGLFKTFMAKSEEGTCGIGGGSMSCTGPIKSLASAGKGARTVETYAMQSPENWIEDFGSAKLENGVAVVRIEPAFGETVTGDATYHVFLTPNGDSKGLYVISKTATTFEVRESGGGTSTLSFDYRIVAKRRGFEAQRLVDVTERFNGEMKAAAMIKSRSVGHPATLERKKSPLALAAQNARTQTIAPRVAPASGKPVSRVETTVHP